MRYDNPNPRGNNFVKFDGIETRGGEDVLLIDAKSGRNGIGPVFLPNAAQKQADQFNRVAEALHQNPGVKVVYEFEHESAMKAAREWVRYSVDVEDTFKNMLAEGRIMFRVRK